MMGASTEGRIHTAVGQRIATGMNPDEPSCFTNYPKNPVSYSSGRIFMVLDFYISAHILFCYEEFSEPVLPMAGNSQHDPCSTAFIFVSKSAGERH